MIKRIVFLLMFSIVALCGSAQQIDGLFSNFSKLKDVEEVNVGKFLMTLARPFVKGPEASLVRSIDQVQVINLAGCSAEVKSDFLQQVNNLKDDKYDVLMDVREEKQNVRMYAIQQNEIIQELIILVTGNDPTLIRMKGKITMEDIQNIAASHKK